jgi:hypothetical protein
MLLMNSILIFCCWVLGNKIPGVVARSHTIITGNRVMLEWATQFNSNVALIPTSVDLRRYVLHSSASNINKIPVIGWIGTPITARYLRALEGVFKKLSLQHEFI